MSGKQNRVEDPPLRKKRLKPAERLPIIRRGIEEGKARRELARELDCDEATIRRDLKKLDLPPEQLAAIQAGDSAEKYLNAALLRKTSVDRSARNKIGRRRREEEKTGKHSDSLADALFDWLSTKRFLNWDTELLLKRAIWYSKPLADGLRKAEHRKLREVVAQVERERASSGLENTRDVDFIEPCAMRLATALVRVESAQIIRQSALGKALDKVRARGHWTDVLVLRNEKVQTEKDRIAKRRESRGGNEA